MYNSYCGTQGQIKPDLIKRNGQKTYPSLHSYGCKQEVITYSIHNLKTDYEYTKTYLAQASNIKQPNFYPDQGWQYQHSQFQAWLKDRRIKQPMSRKDNSLDNGLMKGFFGLLKWKMPCGFETQFKNLNELEEAIPKYISYYNKQRIKVKLKRLSLIEYRELVLVLS